MGSLAKRVTPDSARARSSRRTGTDWAKGNTARHFGCHSSGLREILLISELIPPVSG